MTSTRRTWLGLVCICGVVVGSVVLHPAAHAQPTSRSYRLGILDNEASLQTPRLAAFLQGLRAHGWIEGQNLVIEARLAGDDQFPTLARQLVGLGPDVLFAPKTAAAQASQNVTRSIPIVIAVATDPIASGFVTSLARPGGNITGTTSMLQDLGAKQLELLKVAIPRVRRIAVFANRHHAFSPNMLRELETASKTLGVEAHAVDWSDPDRLDSAFAAVSKMRADAVLVLPNSINIRHGQRVAERALKHRLPSIGVSREWAETSGGLLAYGPNQTDLYRRAARYVDMILRGAKPTDLPVEQPTTLELVINTKVAKALNLTIPPDLLQRADRIVE